MKVPVTATRAAGWIVMAALALASGTVLHAQPVTLEWGAALEGLGSLMDTGAGPVVDSRDSLAADVSLSHQLGPGEMTYSAGADFFYVPQELLPGANAVDQVLVYPSQLAISWELDPARSHDAWMKASLGRMDAREPTGLLLENPFALHPLQLMDGMSFELRYQAFYVSASAGYLGLLDKRINRVLLTTTDFQELLDTSQYAAPPRGLAIVRLEAEQLLAGQSVGLLGIWQKDFRLSDPRFDSWYFGTMARGQILPFLRHVSSILVGVGVPSSGSATAGVLVSSELALKLPGALLHETWLSVLWASGPAGGLSAFPALAGPPVSLAFDQPLSDVVKLEVGADASLPVPPHGAILRPALATRLILVPSGTVPAGSMIPMSGPYVGTEIETDLRYRAISGFNVELRAGGLVTVSRLLPYVMLETGVKL